MQGGDSNAGESNPLNRGTPIESGQGGGTIFRIELSPQQVAFLTRLLPINYSLQFEPKPTKRTASSQKSISADVAPFDPKKKSSKVLLLPGRRIAGHLPNSHLRQVHAQTTSSTRNMKTRSMKNTQRRKKYPRRTPSKGCQRRSSPVCAS